MGQATLTRWNYKIQSFEDLLKEIEDAKYLTPAQFLRKHGGRLVQVNYLLLLPSKKLVQQNIDRHGLYAYSPRQLATIFTQGQEYTVHSQDPLFVKLFKKGYTVPKIIEAIIQITPDPKKRIVATYEDIYPFAETNSLMLEDLIGKIIERVEETTSV